MRMRQAPLQLKNRRIVLNSGAGGFSTGPNKLPILKGK
jgi:hypothetical protein